MTRGAWAVVMLAAWGGALGWLFKREFFRPTSARLAEAARSISPSAVYYRLDISGQQIGFASTTLDTLGDSIRVDEMLVLEVPTLGRLNRTSARSTAVVGRTLQLRSLGVRFDDAHGSFTATGAVFADTVLRLQLVSSGDSQWTRANIHHRTAIPALLPLRLAFGGELHPGTTRSVHVFDPVLLAERQVQVKVANETTLVVADSADFDSTAMAWIPARFDTVPAFRFDLTSNGLVSHAWIDAQGRIVRSTNAFGLTLERSAFEIAYENFRRRDTTRLLRASRQSVVGEVVAATALTAGVNLIAGGPPRAELRVRLPAARNELDWAGLWSRSERRGDTLVLRAAAESVSQARYRLPVPTDSSWAPWLAPEPLIQSENPRIRAQARLLAGRERDPARVARRLSEWVHAEVRKHAAGGEAVPNAVNVFETRRGDCNEHTVLYVALARAGGIPARAVAGLLYREGRFYYHAWPEVYLGDWMAVDPMLGQFPADATHLPLVTGGLARPLELLRLVGKLTLEVL